TIGYKIAAVDCRPGTVDLSSSPTSHLHPKLMPAIKAVGNLETIKINNGLDNGQSQAGGTAVDSLFVETFKNARFIQCFRFSGVDHRKGPVFYQHLDFASGMVVDNGIFQ